MWCIKSLPPLLPQVCSRPYIRSQCSHCEAFAKQCEVKVCSRYIRFPMGKHLKAHVPDATYFCTLAGGGVHAWLMCEG